MLRSAKLGLSSALCVVVACASSSLVVSARSGDRAALASQLAAADSAGHLTLGQAADVARAVVAHELKTAATPDLAIARIHDVHACAYEVDDALEERMDRADVAAGEAALLREETGTFYAVDDRERSPLADDRWRAVAVWRKVGQDDGKARQDALNDGSPLVRRAALRAIASADDPGDFAAVLEAARKDPDLLLRATAVRTLARLSSPPADVVTRLKDLWTDADDGLRADLAAALSAPSILPLGGAAELSHLLDVSRDNDAVTVAGVLVGAVKVDPSLQARAMDRLVAALKNDGRRAKVHALVELPLGRAPKSALDAVREAAKSDDSEVRLAALGKLSDRRGVVPEADRTAAVADLERLAYPGDGGGAGSSLGSRARFLLAEAGDARVQAWLEQDLRSSRPDERLAAAEGLAALHRASRAAPLLADEDVEVRMHAACIVLLAKKRQ
jgi:HEAT repeat protein